MNRASESSPQVERLRFRMPKHPDEHNDADPVDDANTWFVRMFPAAVKMFGPGFMTASYSEVDGLTRCIPVELNEDAWAAALSDQRLGHRLVFYAPENAWWFYDYRVDAFCATSEQKLQALLSNFLIRCAQDCGSLVDIRPIVSEFRKTGILERVIARAKALLEADRSFFTGEHGHRRMIDGKIIEPTAKPSYATFVEQALVTAPAQTLTVAQAFSHYAEFCDLCDLPPLTRAEFRSMASQIISRRFHKGLRKDVLNERGRQNEGWYDLAVRPMDELALGRN